MSTGASKIRHSSCIPFCVMTRAFLPALMLAITLACASDNSLPADSADPDDTDTPVDTAVDTADPLPIPPLWYSVDGRWILHGGAVGPGSTLELAVWGREGDQAVRLCTDTIDASGSLDVQPPDDEVAVFGMWAVSTTEGGCADRPAEVRLGIGPLLPDLWPAADAEGASLKHTRGLYVADGDRLWVSGLAATAEQAQGLGAPPSLDPLPDGRYHLRGVWLLPL